MDGKGNIHPFVGDGYRFLKIRLSEGMPTPPPSEYLTFTEHFMCSLGGFADSQKPTHRPPPPQTSPWLEGKE